MYIVNTVRAESLSNRSVLCVKGGEKLLLDQIVRNPVSVLKFVD
jgi:hypothetical protein